MLTNLKKISSRASNRSYEVEYRMNEKYHDIKMQGMFHQKKKLFEKIDFENNRLKNNIASQ